MSFVADLKGFLRGAVLSRREADQWPFHHGKYHVLDPTAPVVIVFQNDAELANDLAALAPDGLCLVCASCRNATDIDRLIRNVASNLAVHFVVLAGDDSVAGSAIAALEALLGGGGDDEDEKVVALAAAVREKLDSVDLDALAKQVQPVNMLGCVQIERIISAINELATDASRPTMGFRAPREDTQAGIRRVIAATNVSYDGRSDKAGDFIVRLEKGKIVVEHYNSKRELLRIIEGTTARDLCLTLNRNGWVSNLDHAAYLGRELMRAQVALREGFEYVQDAESKAVETSSAISRD